MLSSLLLIVAATGLSTEPTATGLSTEPAANVTMSTTITSSQFLQDGVFSYSDSFFVKDASGPAALLSIKSRHSIEADLVDKVKVEVGNLGPIFSSGGTLRMKSMDLGTLEQCQVGISRQSYLVPESRTALNPPRVAVEYGDYEYFVTPRAYSVIGSNLEYDLEEGLTLLAADYPCLEEQILPGTVHRWRWVIVGPGMANDAAYDDDETTMAVENVLDTRAGFGFIDPDRGVAAVLSFRNALTFVANYRSVKATMMMLQEVFYGPVHPEPPVATTAAAAAANSTEAVEEETTEMEFSDNPEGQEYSPDISLSEDYWVDLVITSGSERVLRLDVWIRDEYKGAAVLTLPEGLRIQDLDLTPVTLPLTHLYQDLDSQILFLAYAPDDTVDPVTDKDILGQVKMVDRVVPYMS